MKRGAVTLWTGKYQEWAYCPFYASSNLYEKISYVAGDMNRLNCRSNSVSVVKIPFGYAVELFNGDVFNGESLVLRGPFWTDQTMSDGVYDLEDTFDNRTSSL